MDDRDRRDHHAPWMPWAITSLALVVVAMIAYSAGAHREAVVVGATDAREWHVGFPGFWGFLVLFWIFGGLRWMSWGGARYCRPWRYRRYAPPYDEEREWEAWHRREHERMSSSTGTRPIT